MRTNLERFKPRIRQGRLIPHGRYVILEVDHPYNQVVLPIAMADFIALSGGEFTVRQIIEKIYRRQGSVPFKALLDTIFRLYQGGFFENDHELELSSELKSWLKEPKRGPFLHWVFGQRLTAAYSMPWVFYGLTMAVLAVSILGLLLWPSNSLDELSGWIRSRDSFWISAFQVYLLNSMMLTLRHWASAAQMLLLKGKVYNLSIRFAPWGTYLHMSDENTELLDHRLFVCLFHLSQILLPWSVVALMDYWGFLHIDTLLLVAMASTIWELNPMLDTKARKLLRALIFKPNDLSNIFTIETSELLRHVYPEQARSEHRFTTVSFLSGLLWTGLLMWMLHSTGQEWGSRVLDDLARIESEFIPVASIFGALCWVGLAILGLKQFFSAGICLIRPGYLGYTKKISARLHHYSGPTQWTKTALAETLKELPLFSDFEDGQLNELIDQCNLHAYSKGETLFHQGDTAAALFVLLEGELFIERKVSPQSKSWKRKIKAVSIFGESALVGDQGRFAQTDAATHAIVLSVPIVMVEGLAKRTQTIRKLEVYRNAIIVNQFFSSSPVFRSLAPESIEYLTRSGQMEYFDKDQIVFRQGDLGDSLYLVLRGSVDVEIHRSPISNLDQGTFFGEIALIANIPRTATIRAAEPTVLFKIHNDTFWSLLVNHFDLGVFIESISEERLKEGLEKLNLIA